VNGKAVARLSQVAEVRGHDEGVKDVRVLLERGFQKPNSHVSRIVGMAGKCARAETESDIAGMTV
jgi:hypothetical protein